MLMVLMLPLLLRLMLLTPHAVPASPALMPEPKHVIQMPELKHVILMPEQKHGIHHERSHRCYA